MRSDLEALSTPKITKDIVDAMVATAAVARDLEFAAGYDFSGSFLSNGGKLAADLDKAIDMIVADGLSAAATKAAPVMARVLQRTEAALDVALKHEAELEAEVEVGGESVDADLVMRSEGRLALHRLNEIADLLSAAEQAASAATEDEPLSAVEEADGTPEPWYLDWQAPETITSVEHLIEVMETELRAICAEGEDNSDRCYRGGMTMDADHAHIVGTEFLELVRRLAASTAGK